MNSKRYPAQPEPFATPPQPRSRERARVYDAVLYLRAAGLRIYRAGRETHLVNGSRITTRELLERAGV
jgi:hypothetical protein